MKHVTSTEGGPRGAGRFGSVMTVLGMAVVLHASGADPARGATSPGLRETRAAAAIQWEVAAGWPRYQARLVVKALDGRALEREFRQGEPLRFDLTTASGAVLADGLYYYELTVGNPDAPASTLRSSGSFRLRGGLLVSPEKSDMAAAAGPQPNVTNPEGNHFVGDVTITGELCVGTGECPDGHDPAKQLELANISEAFIRFTDTGAAATNWELGIPDTSDGFVLSDVDAATTPFKAQLGAATDTLVLGTGTQVGIGTSTPTDTLHVTRSDGTTKVTVEETSATRGTREMFRLANNGNPFFVFADMGVAQSYSFAMFAGDFIISQQQNPGVEFRLTPTGNLTITGTLTQGSSRESKHEIEPVDRQAVLDKVVQLPLAQWTYRKDETGARHLGPMAEDFAQAFRLGANDKGISALDTSGVALAAIQGLHERFQKELEDVSRQKDREIEALQKRLEVLEMLLTSRAARAN